MNYKIFSLYDKKRNLIQEARFKSFEWAVITLEAEDGTYYITDGMHEIEVEVSSLRTRKGQKKSFKLDRFEIIILRNNTCSVSNDITNTTFRFDINNQEKFYEKLWEHKEMLMNTKRIDLTNRLNKIEKQTILTLEQQMAIQTALQALKDTGDYAEEDYKAEIKTIEKLLR